MNQINKNIIKKDMLKNKKAAIQLSMSFLVMLIIAITVFIMSLAFLTDLFKGATELKSNLDDQTVLQIEKMLQGNTRVAIPVETKTIKRGESTSFGLGIKNTVPEKPHFYVEVHNKGRFIPIEDKESLYDLNCGAKDCTIGNRYSSNNYNGEKIIDFIIGRNGKLDIDVNNQESLIVAVGTTNNAPRGHYILNVKICSTENNVNNFNCNSVDYYDDTIHKIHLNVE